MSSRNLSYEQPSSLINRLTDAGFRHGDTAEVTLEGVGIHMSRTGEPCLAFCPTRISYARILRRGSVAERRQSMPTIFRLSNSLQKRMFRNAPLHGFVTLSLQIYSNHSSGVIHLGGRVSDAIEVHNGLHVHGTNSYNDYVGIAW